MPLRLISRALPQAFTQMSDYMTSAVSNTENTSQLTQVPYTTQAVLSAYLQTANSQDQTNTRDDAGLPLVYGSCKLLDMLGYGSMIASSNTGKAAITQKYLGLDKLSDGVNPLVYASSQTVNALPFLAYQKIYFDFFSNSQWEKHLAYAYNVDYWTGGSSIALTADMLKIRYANYPKIILWGCFRIVSMVMWLHYRVFIILKVLLALLLLLVILMWIMSLILLILLLLLPLERLLRSVLFSLIPTFPHSQSVRRNICSARKK